MNQELNDLQKREMIREVKDTGNLSASLSEIPLRKFYDQALYLDKILMPAIERKSGNKSADYQFFAEVYRSLLYAVLIVDRGNKLILERQQLKQLNKLWQERADLAERELLKYTTVEDLMMTDTMDKIAASVKERIENLLK